VDGQLGVITQPVMLYVELGIFVELGLARTHHPHHMGLDAKD